MVQNILVWLAAFGLSIILAEPLAIVQPELFMYIYLGVSVAVIAVIAIILVVAGTVAREGMAVGLSFALIAIVAVKLVVVLVAAYLMSQWVGIDFFTTYMIMALGSAFTSNGSKKDKN